VARSLSLFPRQQPRSILFDVHLAICAICSPVGERVARAIRKTAFEDYDAGALLIDEMHDDLAAVFGDKAATSLGAYFKMVAGCSFAAALEAAGQAEQGAVVALRAARHAAFLGHWNVVRGLLWVRVMPAIEESETTSDLLFDQLRLIAADVEWHFGEAGTHFVRRSCDAMLRRMIHGGGKFSPKLVVGLTDLVQGHRYANALMRQPGGLRSAVSDPPDLRGKDVPLPPVADPAKIFRYAEDLAGTERTYQPSEIVYRRYDADLYRSVYGGSTDTPTVDPLLLRKAIAHDEVVLNLIYGKFDEESQFILGAAHMSDNDELAARLALNESVPWAPEPFPVVDGSVLQVLTQTWRNFGPDTDHPDLEIALNRAEHNLLHTLRDVLEAEYVAGRRELTLIQGGILRGMPTHLLPFRGQPLAASWKVAYAPSMRGLTKRLTASQPGHEITLSVYGYAPGDPDAGLPALAGVDSETAAIAEMFGTRPVTGPEATAQAILSSLGRSRYVHIATHGTTHAVPSFHALVTAPQRSGDAPGRLWALQLLGHDFSGTDLVTLSACDSSLIRYDKADNPRGIVANLLLSGVRYVVGAMWPVKTSVARDFFIAMYQHLGGGEDVRGSFAHAQAETRLQYPAARDWGVFTLISAW
jgi:CHAT domain-containing protein